MHKGQVNTRQDQTPGARGIRERASDQRDPYMLPPITVRAPAQWINGMLQCQDPGPATSLGIGGSESEDQLVRAQHIGSEG